MWDVMHFMSLYGAKQKSIAKYWQDYTLSTSLIKLRAKHQFKVYKSLNCHARTVLWCHFPYFKRSLLLLASPFLWETRLPYFQKKFDRWQERRGIFIPLNFACSKHIVVPRRAFIPLNQYGRPNIKPKF